jgi:hypothetical protein
MDRGTRARRLCFVRGEPIVRQLKQIFHLTLGENLEEVLALVKQKDSIIAKSGRLQTGLSKSSLGG